MVGRGGLKLSRCLPHICSREWTSIHTKIWKTYSLKRQELAWPIPASYTAYKAWNLFRINNC
jgi:hypothetical protein